MGTCKIVEWCENPKCIDGCLAEAAIIAERIACAEIVQSTADLAHEGPPEKAARAFMLDNCVRAILWRRSKYDTLDVIA